MNASNCCDCDSDKVESCLCHKCIQKIINNANSLGRKEGAKNTFDVIILRAKRDLVCAVNWEGIHNPSCRKCDFIKNLERLKELK